MRRACLATVGAMLGIVMGRREGGEAGGREMSTRFASSSIEACRLGACGYVSEAEPRGNQYMAATQQPCRHRQRCDRRRIARVGRRRHCSLPEAGLPHAGRATRASQAHPRRALEGIRFGRRELLARTARIAPCPKQAKRCHSARDGLSHCGHRHSQKPFKARTAPAKRCLRAKTAQTTLPALHRSPAASHTSPLPRTRFSLYQSPVDLLPPPTNELERPDQERHSGASFLMRPAHLLPTLLTMHCRRRKPSSSASISYVSLCICPWARCPFAPSSGPLGLFADISATHRVRSPKIPSISMPSAASRSWRRRRRSYTMTPKSMTPADSRPLSID